MSLKTARNKRTSSGARKNRTDKSGRKSPVVADPAGLNFIRHQSDSRWPDQDTLIKAQELSMKKHPRGRAKTKPMTMGFTVMDCLLGNSQDALLKLLLAASLKIKPVRRYPGYVLIKTYNLKDRPIQII